ncbi:MAG TPA: phosphotransacetylase family protein [Dehalococcoidia bacterium]|nr:phosphotransacetylase family protein [Dehalococcoidia bacterium]
MTAIFVTSLTEGGGKTSICAGLAQHMVGEGKKVGFMKPVTMEGVDSDALLMKNVLSLAESPEDISPFIGDSRKISGIVKQTYDRISKDKDIVIIEGPGSAGEAAQKMAAAVNAKVIIVGGPEESPGAKMIVAQKLFGKNLLGVILNKVPVSFVEGLRDKATAAFKEAGIKVLGLLPEDRALFTLTVSELADGINGEILNSAEKSGELAENIMLGAMTVDTGPLYFGRKENKVAVLRSERSDMQLAALQTSTRGLVISGEQKPLPQVMGEAVKKDVPIIMAGDDVTTIVSNIEDTMARTRFSVEKLPRISTIITEYLDLPALGKALGIKA